MAETVLGWLALNAPVVSVVPIPKAKDEAAAEAEPELVITIAG